MSAIKSSHVDMRRVFYAIPHYQYLIEYGLIGFIGDNAVCGFDAVHGVFKGGLKCIVGSSRVERL